MPADTMVFAEASLKGERAPQIRCSPRDSIPSPRKADPESDYYLRLLEANVSHPRVSDLVFHRSDNFQAASAQQVVDEALKYRPIAL
ncbi:hypothetical protein ACIGO6_40935 [Streptomyces sp. NPDC053750]|uniref:hypothetical protein n=1 Tax=Streptomyces sp. NPDC053750 TaxID=3365714 RepID=UPI0037D4E4D0